MRRKVFLFLIGFFFLMGGIALISSFFLQIWREKRASSHPTPILRIVQKTQSGPSLPTLFLEQLLELSIDHPPDFYVWDEKAALEKLLSFPLIQSASVKKVWPQIISVVYSLKKPIATLLDYENVAIDEKGSLLPILPFLPLEKVPEVYMDLPPFGVEDPLSLRKGGSWKEPLTGKQIELALHILSILSSDAIEKAFTVERIDLSKIFADSYGKREIVIFTKTERKMEGKKQSYLAVFPQILRLSPIHYAQGLGNYFELHKKMMKDYQEQMKEFCTSGKEIVFRPKTIDLRLDKLGFIDER
jgi:hypothetical protein